MTDEFIHAERTAYFSMEIALRPEIPTYAGGLGVLAGDTLRSAADLQVPMVAVTLVSRAGYFRQALSPTGAQIEHPDPWDPARWTRTLDARVSVPIEGRKVWVAAHLYVVEAPLGGRQPVVLLDTDLGDNDARDREITHYLYGGDDAAYRLKQEIVLGIGGVRMLQALGFRIRQYHMNEGHAALLTLELLRRHAYGEDEVRPGEPRYDIPMVRELCDFTTHTPVEAGHDQFDYPLVDRVLGPLVDGETLRALAGSDALNMTRLALNLSEFINGVARKHAATSRAMYPGYHVNAVTNGVHPSTWTTAPFAKLYDARLPGWCHEPGILVRADCCIDPEAIGRAHAEAKAALAERVQALCGIALAPDVPTLGFARRMTAYKRPELLFTDVERLASIAGRHRLQVVLAGKAHPHDAPGKRLVEELHAHMRALAGTIPIAYLPNYDMELAKLLVSGVDVWLNTPLPPLEASGTSGMKAAFNGVPSLSVLDGWWVEGCIEGVTGWAVGDGDAGRDDAASLYDKLERVVLPLYYGPRAEWLKVMRGAIAKNASFFNSHRMMRRYVCEAYIR